MLPVTSGGLQGLPGFVPFTHNRADMDLNSPLFDRIRIKPQCDAPRAAADGVCEREGCAEPGTFRAPKGRNAEGQYWRFCKDHVAEYNKSYNYFAGMSDAAVMAYQKDASIGHRPTWSMGVNAAGRSGTAQPQGDFDYADPLGVFRAAGFEQHRRAPEPPKPRRPGPILRALEILDLDENADGPTIKAKYKELVKRFHPDAHGGDRSFEERLRDIIRAHDTLKAAGLC